MPLVPPSGEAFVIRKGIRVAIDSVIEQCIREILGQTCLRLTPRDLIRKVRERSIRADAARIRSVFRKMVTAGELIYTQHCATTHLQIAGVGVVALKRAELPLSSARTETDKWSIIHLEPGLAFGAGDHPTTCLCLEGLRAVTPKIARWKPLEQAEAIDIGTGSGVLAIAAAMLGFGWSLGVDIDPAACFEARRNALRNGVRGNIAWMAGTMAALGLHRRFDTVLANLRPPTLVALMPVMEALTLANGFWILSGFRPDEVISIQRSLPRQSVVCQVMQNREWAAIVVRWTEMMCEGRGSEGGKT